MNDEGAAPGAESQLIRRGVAWKLSAGLVTHVFRILVALVLARLLTPHEYGLAGMALVVSSFVLAFSDLALGSALIQRKEITERDRSTMFWITAAAGLLFTVVGVAASGVAASLFDEPEARDLFAVMSLSFLITSLGATQTALLTRSMNFKRLELRVIVGTVVGGAVGIAVAADGGGAWAIVLQQLTLAVVSTMLLWVATPWRPRFLVSLESLRSLGAYSANVIGNRIAYVAQDTATPLMIGRFLGASSLGLYALANNVALIPISRITVPLGAVLFPAFSRQQDDRDRVGAMWLSALSLSSAVTLPALAGLVVVAPDFVSTVLGEKWAEVVPVLQILACVAAMRAIQGPTASVMLAIGRANTLFRFSAVYFVAVVGSVGLGIPWGIIGVATMLAICATTLGTVWLGLVGRHVGIPLVAIWHALRGVSESTAVMAVAVLCVRLGLERVGVGSAARLLVCIVVGVLSYVAMCRWREPAVLERLVGNVKLIRRNPASSPAKSPRASGSPS